MDFDAPEPEDDTTEAIVASSRRLQEQSRKVIRELDDALSRSRRVARRKPVVADPADSVERPAPR